MKEEAQEATTQAVEVFGQKLVGLLQAAGPAAREAPKEEKRSLARTFELAFSTALSAYTHWMMCSWFFDDDRQEGHDGLDLEGMLSEVYARVREGGKLIFRSDIWFRRVGTECHFIRGASCLGAMAISYPEACAEDVQTSSI
jgi:hypothetical protein